MDPEPSYLDAQVDELVRALRSYGVLSRDRLADVAGADRWRGADFTVTLHEAVRRGAVRDLGEEMYEVAPEGT